MNRIGGLEELTASRANVELAFLEAKRNRGKKNALAKDMDKKMAQMKAIVKETAKR